MYQFQSSTTNDGELPTTNSSTTTTSKPSPSTYTDSIKFYEKMSHLHNQLKTYEQKQFVLEDEFQKLWTEQQTLNNTSSNKNETSSQMNGNSTAPAPDYYSNSNPVITLENDTNRKLRNAKILAKIQELESTSAIFTARSERLRIMKTEYESLIQKYKNPARVSTTPSSTSTSSIKVMELKEEETKLCQQPITRGVNTYITGPIISQETILTSTPSTKPAASEFQEIPAQVHKTTMRMGVGNPSYNLKPTFEENFGKFTNSGNKQLHTIFTPTSTSTSGINLNGCATNSTTTNGFIKRILDFEGIEESGEKVVDADVGRKNLYFDISSTSDSDQETSKSIEKACTLKRSGSIRMTGTGTGGGKRVSYNIDTSDTSNTTSMGPLNLKIKPEITQNQNLQGILKTSNSKMVVEVEPTASESTTVSESISSKNKLRNENENENEIQNQDSKDQGSFDKLNNSVFGTPEVDKMMMNEMEIDLSQDQESVDEIPSFRMEEEIELDKDKDLIESQDFGEKNELLVQKIETGNELNGLGNTAGGFNSGFLNNLGKNEGLGEKRDLDLEKNDNDLWNERDIDQEILKASQTQVINEIPNKSSEIIEKNEQVNASESNSASNTTTATTTGKRRLKLKLDYGDSESDSSEKIEVISSEKNTNKKIGPKNDQENGKSVNYKEVDDDGGNSRAFNLPSNKTQVIDDDFDDFFDI